MPPSSTSFPRGEYTLWVIRTKENSSVNRTLEVSTASARLSLSEPWAYLCRSRQPAADIVPLLIIEQISKTGSFIPAHPPPHRHFQTGPEKAPPPAMPCPVVFIQPSYSSYLSSPSQLLFSTLILQFLGPDSETKCPTMNKTTALFSVPHGNLITWYEHFIVSKLLFYQSPFLTLKWEVRSLYRVEPKAPLGSINYVCVSAPQPPGGSLGLWLKWFSAEPFCQVKHSEKPVTRKPQCSPRLHLWDLAPHTCSPNLALDGWCD